MNVKKGIISISISAVMLFSPAIALAQQASPDAFTRQLMEWQEQGIDPNHTETIEAVNNYIEQHIDPGVFASLHIDREERLLGILVYSFTEPIQEEHIHAMRELVTDHAEIMFREVAYTEAELQEKQREVDRIVFELENIKVFHTSVDIIGNQVEIGVEDPSEEVIQQLHDLFGEEMISVVQGAQAYTLADTADQSSNEKVEQDEQKAHNAFQRVLNMLRTFFHMLF